MKTINKINATSTLIRACQLLGAKYSTKDEFEYLRLPDGRSYQIITLDDSWKFHPLWAVDKSIVVDNTVTAEDLKDVLLGHLVAVRGQVIFQGRRNE